MPEETTTTVIEEVNTSAGDGKNTETSQGAGAVTQTETTKTEAHKEKTFTQADVDRIVGDRLKKAVKAELRKLAGETDGQPTVDELQRQLQDSQSKTRHYETRDAISQFIADPKNKVAARTENMRAIEKLVLSEIEFDEAGKPENLKDAIERVKLEAPTLFVTSNGSINGHDGKNTALPADFNNQIRQSLGYAPR